MLRNARFITLPRSLARLMPRTSLFVVFVIICITIAAAKIGQQKMPLVSPSPVTSSATLIRDERIPQELISRLSAIAEESFTVKYQTLVSGDLNSSLKNKPLAQLHKGAMMKTYKSQIDRRSYLKRTKQDYKRFETSIRVNEAIGDGVSNVSLKVTEETMLDLDVPGGPPKTGYLQDHLLEYSNILNQWVLVRDTLIQPSPPPIANPEQLTPSAFTPIPLTHAPKGYSSDALRQSMMRRDTIKPGTFSGMQSSFTSPLSGFPITRDAAPGDLLFAPRRAFVSYNKADAGTYARDHALAGTYNTAQYATFHNDCTNFVSQSVYAGGWTLVGLTGYTNNQNWFYYCKLAGKPYATYSWGAAFNFHEFMNSSGRADAVAHYESLVIGDLIFADWDSASGGHTPDGRVDHAMIVTAFDTAGNVYVSYHTNDTLDRSMADIALHEPSAVFHGYRLKTSF